MENILVAASNLVALPGLIRAYNTTRYTELCLVSGSMTSSIFYHLAEKSKHYMHGLAALAPYEKVFLNFDRVCACLSILFFGFKYYNVLMTDQSVQVRALIGVLTGTFSEIGLRTIRPPHHIHKWLFIVSHIIWHFCAFDVANQLLKYQQLPFGNWRKLD